MEEGQYWELYCGLPSRRRQSLVRPSGALGFAVNQLKECMYEAELIHSFLIFQVIHDSVDS